ncbi:MAG: hypothetical protein ACXVIR_11570 [Halobacteriota archaeon]
MTRKTMLTATLTDEICDLVSRGAVDSTVCRIIGIHRSTLWDWKRRGRDPDAREPLFGIFYERYQQACGYRTLAWIESLQRKGEFKWLLTHSPDSKQDWADVREIKKETKLSVDINAEVKDYIDRIDAYRKALRELENQS